MLNPETLRLHHGVGLNGRSHRFPQNRLETLVSHSQQVMTRLALCGFQIKTGAAAKLQYLHTGVNHDAIRRITVLNGAIGALLQLAAAQRACGANAAGGLWDALVARKRSMQAGWRRS